MAFQGIGICSQRLDVDAKIIITQADHAHRTTTGIVMSKYTTVQIRDNEEHVAQRGLINASVANNITMMQNRTEAPFRPSSDSEETAETCGTAQQVVVGDSASQDASTCQCIALSHRRTRRATAHTVYAWIPIASTATEISSKPRLHKASESVPAGCQYAPHNQVISKVEESTTSLRAARSELSFAQ